MTAPPPAEALAAGERAVVLRVNGAQATALVEGRTLLSDALRHGLGLTGTHVGCEQGACGACTVLVDGRAVRSCLVLAVQVEGSEIMTVEGLAPTSDIDALDVVQQALHRHHGLQCGFCTPGIVMSLVAARARGASLEEAIEEELGGHLCRCTGYVNIRAAVVEAWAAADQDADTGLGTESESESESGIESGIGVEDAAVDGDEVAAEDRAATPAGAGASTGKATS